MVSTVGPHLSNEIGVKENKPAQHRIPRLVIYLPVQPVPFAHNEVPKL